MEYGKEILTTFTLNREEADDLFQAIAITLDEADHILDDCHKKVFLELADILEDA